MKRLLATLLLCPCLAPAASWQPSVTTSATWDNNVTNADRGSDRLGALDLQSRLIAAQRFTVSRDDSVWALLRAAGDWWPAYNALSSASAGVGAEWQHKFGLGPFAPVMNAVAAADGVAARDPERSGGNYTGSVAFRKRLTAATRVELSETFSRRDERTAVYDRDAAETAFTAIQSLGDRLQIAVTGFWRQGDIISYATPPRPDLIALAPRRQLEGTFGAPRVAYSIRADSIGVRLETAWTLNARANLTLGYEYRDTSRSTLRYVNQLVSGSLALQF